MGASLVSARQGILRQNSLLAVKSALRRTSMRLGCWRMHVLAANPQGYGRGSFEDRQVRFQNKDILPLRRSRVLFAGAMLSTGGSSEFSFLR